MENKKPPFVITNRIIDYVAEIAELVGKLDSANPFSANPTLRRSNRIRKFMVLLPSSKTRFRWSR